MLVIVAMAVLLVQAAEPLKQAVPDPVTLEVSPDCEWISRGHPELVPVAQACEAGLAMNSSLPNFVCDLKVTRDELVRIRMAGGTSFLKRTDHISARVTYLNGEEEITDIKVNGKPTTDPEAASSGSWSRGEFSPPGILVLGQRWVPAFSADSRNKAGDAPLLNFDYSVEQQYNQVWTWRFAGRAYHPGFTGSLTIDRKSGFVRRFRMLADNAPADIPYSKVETSVDYDSVAIPSLGVYQLPVKSVVTICRRGDPGCVTNVKEYSGCRKFAAKARIVE